MKRTLLLFLFVSLHGILLFAPAAASLQGLHVGMKGPEFSLRSLGGEPRTSADLKGEKLTIVVFWATWSKKSESVLARMQQLYGKYKGLGLSVVAVNVDGQNFSEKMLADIVAVQEKLQIGFPMLADQGLVTFHDYGVIAVPTTVIMDRERVITYELSGYPLVGGEAMSDFVVSTMEGKKQSVVSAEKTGYHPNKSALRFYNMGETTLKSRRLADTAEIWFKKSAEADARFVLPHLGLGKLYLQRGDGTLARREFEEALAREPANPIALCETGMILVNEGKADEGVSLFEAARKAEESYAPCYYYAGYAYGKLGRLADAMKMFEEAETVDPFDYASFVYKGKVLEEQKDWRKAFDAYKKGLEIILHLN
ncbi:MAG TPA: redoxin domain-containing protein [Geobacteraceae bacterium]